MGGCGGCGGCGYTDTLIHGYNEFVLVYRLDKGKIDGKIPYID
jgi:hypothetical protein